MSDLVVTLVLIGVFAAAVCGLRLLNTRNCLPLTDADAAAQPLEEKPVHGRAGRS